MSSAAPPRKSGESAPEAKQPRAYGAKKKFKFTDLEKLSTKQRGWNAPLGEPYEPMG